MNLFLQFKNNSYATAYSHDLKLQLKRRTAMISLIIVVFIIANGISLGLNPALGPTRSKILICFRLGVCILTFGGIYLLKRNVSKCKKHIGKINIILDVLTAMSPFVVYPLAGNYALDRFSNLGMFIYSWSTAVCTFAMAFTFGNWWMKAVVSIAQYIYFFIFLFQQESYCIPIFIFGIEAIILYLALTYLQEKYDRINFLEKQTIYDNYEAIKKIVDDISQGIMIVDQSNEVIYANRIVYTLLNQDQQQSVSLSTLFSQVNVKSISPQIPIDILQTERVLSTRECENVICTLPNLSYLILCRMLRIL